MSSQSAEGISFMPRNNKWLKEPTTIYTLALGGVICTLIILEPHFSAIIDSLVPRFPILRGLEFLPERGMDFMNNFIQWFGVLYGFLLPLLLVRAWEQFDKIDREFDREADTFRILFDDVRLTTSINTSFKSRILNLLFDYVGHVKKYYPDESEADRHEKGEGDSILREIRAALHELIDSWLTSENDREALSSELLDKLNDAVNVRGDRISLCNQRIFESLRIVAMITSLIFVVPFYFVKFHQPYGFLDSALVFGVFFLVIFLLTTIEDLDEPYSGAIRLNEKPWLDLHLEIAEGMAELNAMTSAEEDGVSIEKNTKRDKRHKARKGSK